VLARIEAADEVEVDPKASSLDLLQAVYRNPDVPLSVRMRAAGMAIPYEFPKLSVVASVNDPEGFAERLERAIQRSGVPAIDDRGEANRARSATANERSWANAGDREEGEAALGLRGFYRNGHFRVALSANAYDRLKHDRRETLHLVHNAFLKGFPIPVMRR
jgi:hypothetical protein